MNYKNITTIQKGESGGQPTIRGMRTSIYDILQKLVSGMTIKEILEDFPKLTEKDIKASLQFSADKEKNPFMHKLLHSQNCADNMNEGKTINSEEALMQAQ